MDDMCTVCDDVSAEYICMQCTEKMCQSCTKIHKKMAVSRSHDVESLSTLTPERLATIRPALCPGHGDKQAELLCVGHNLVICTSCFSNKHSPCLDVRSLDDKMKSAEKNLGSLTQKLIKTEENLKQSIRNLNFRIKNTDRNEQENMALVDKTCDRLQKMVEECQKQLKKLISDSISKFKDNLYDVKRELEKRLAKVTSHKHLVTRATTVRPRPALIPAAQTLTDRVHNLNLNLSDELKAEPWADPSPEITKYCDDVVTLMKAELQSLTLQLNEAEALVLVFHENCWGNVHLTNNRTTARKALRKIGFTDAVVSRDAMAVNILYEVRIDETIDEADEDDCIQLGVTTSIYDRKNTVIIGPVAVIDKDMWIPCDIGKALNCIKVGSRVGLLVDSLNDLHLYVDGVDQCVVTKQVKQPCFAVFYLYSIIQVTALPTSWRT